MIYDQGRNFTLNISKKNCDEYREFVETIQKKGINGNKAYFRCNVPSEQDGKLEIDLGEVLGAQPW